MQNSALFRSETVGKGGSSGCSRLAGCGSPRVSLLRSAFGLALAGTMMLALAAGAAEKTRVDALAYYGTRSYRSSDVKDDAELWGIYGYIGHGLNHLVEFEVDGATVEYDDGTQLRQWDYTTVYTNFSIPSWKLRTGFHALKSDDGFTDGGITGLVGAHYYVLGKWEAGVDGFVSRYEDYDPDLRVWQLSPHVGLSLWRRGDAALTSDLWGHWIALNEDVGLGERNFRSVEEKLSLIRGRARVSLSGWYGDQTFAVRDGGFTVYNLAEEHTGGFGVEFQYLVGSRSAVRLKATREYFEDFGSDEHSESDTVSVLFGHTF